MKKREYILGAIVGAVVSALIHIVFFRPPPPPGFFQDPERREHHMLNRFANELSLTSQQKEAVEPILSRLGQEMLKLRLSQRDEVERLFQETEKELLPLLNSDQQERLRGMRMHFHEGRRREMEFLRGRGQKMPPW